MIIIIYDYRIGMILSHRMALFLYLIFLTRISYPPELRDDTDSSFVRKTYERYVGKNALNNPQVQFSVSLTRYIVVIKPTKIMSSDFTKIEAS